MQQAFPRDIESPGWIMHNRVGAFVVAGLALLVALGTARSATAQAAKDVHATMASIDAYLMPDRTAEIALARSAAPASISRDATVLVLDRKGYETAVQGKNGFVCMVDRSWSAAFDWDEFWNPKVRAAVCLNPQAVHSLLPIDRLRTRMVMAGRSKAEIMSALKAAFDSRQLPEPETGAMSYMMSKSAYLTNQGSHDLPHVMFYTRLRNGDDWGAGAAGAPILSSPYWYMSSKREAQAMGLPPILVFLVAVPDWSDGTPVSRPVHQGGTATSGH